ncbi:7,8-dihydro-8-oxoguanine triphosphatase [Bacillus sp. J14TS2]|uniref:NUDIX domain-containing protein n=1 Tax=Bacillus sp. J14TS2 TaxID=2807188 RepID=UPI001B0EA35B|nr:8-oxo-dGTP diphosphatase [Bacillus sp. J14TS2]GIN73918.1 7,8-dihydro-8-oxoguanine triphosphatase [Bacillus sp. J14TS2]
MQKIAATLLSMVIVHDQTLNKILLVNRPSKLGFPGYLGPGGKIELTESFAEGAVRELREETGLFVNPEDLIYKGVDEYILVDDHYRYIVFNYVATEFTGELLENPPEGELKWVSKEEIADLPMQSWFRRRLPYFFEKGTFEISIHLKDFESSPIKESIRKIG